MTQCLSCRACGAPLGVALDARCKRCDTATETDPKVRARLLDHAARLALARHEVRAAMAHHLMLAGAGPRRVRLWGAIGAVCLLGLAVACASLPVGLVPGLQLLVPCGIIGGAALALGGCVAVVLGWFGRLLAVAHAQTAERLEGIEPAVDSPCPQCGGHARVLGLGPWPCPFCETPLVVPEAATGAVAGALAVLAEAERDKVLDVYLQGPFAIAPQPVEVGGLSNHLGHVSGTWGDEPVGGGLDGVSGVAVHCVVLPDRAGEVAWLVHRDHLDDHRRLAEALGTPWPDGEARQLGGGWLAWGTLEPPAGLSSPEALHRDAAGLHYWRADTPASVATRSWNWLLPGLRVRLERQR